MTMESTEPVFAQEMIQRVKTNHMQTEGPSGTPSAARSHQEPTQRAELAQPADADELVLSFENNSIAIQKGVGGRTLLQERLATEFKYL